MIIDIPVDGDLTELKFDDRSDRKEPKRELGNIQARFFSALQESFPSPQIARSLVTTCSSSCVRRNGGMSSGRLP